MQPSTWVTEGAGTPGPGMYCTERQMKSYVHDLRDRPVRAASPASPARPAIHTTNSASAASTTTSNPSSPARGARLARPTGSRPPPAHFRTWANRENARVQDIPSFDALHPQKEVGGKAEGQAQAADAPRLHRRGTSNAALDQAVETAGKALVQPPSVSVQSAEGSEVDAAMQKLGLDEERLYEAARDEAAEIVWKHRNPNAPENNPNAPYAYPGPERKTLQRPKLQRTRSRSVGPKDDAEQDLQRANSKMRKRHSIGSSTGSRSSSLQDVVTPTSPDPSALPSPLFSTSLSKKDNDLDLKIAKASSDLPQQRKTSGSHRKPSGTLFQNPNDHIYEEPDEEAPPAPAPTPLAAEPTQPAPLPLGMRRNPFTRFQSVKSNSNGMLRSNTDPIVSMKRFDKYEIHRNEPTQSRNAGYTLNAGKSKLGEVSKVDAENEHEVKMKDGKEVRSDELRAATGFSLRNRSPKLPTPTMVSDAPGRPIVSFQKDYGVVELKAEKSILPPDPKPEPVVEKPVVAEKPPAPPVLEKAATDSVVPTRKSVFERPTSRNAATPSPFERPASRSASPFDRPVSRTGTGSTSPLKEFGPSSSPASTSGGRPSTPKGPFANRSPLGRFNSAASTPSTTPATAPVVTAIPPVPADPYALPSKAETPPVPVDPYALPSKSSTPPVPVDPYALPPTSARPQPPVPSIAVSEARPASRNRFSRPQSVSNIPTISVSESPTSRHGRAGSILSIGVTPPIPTISVSETPAPSTAPPRGRFNRVSTTQAVPTVSVNAPPAVTRGHSFNAPVINLPSDVPTIAINEPETPRPVPTITTPDSTPSARPLPDPRNYTKRPQPQPQPTASAPPTTRPLPTTARTHWTPTTVRTGAQCTACALPISGRIVSAGGCRFHPTCFACYQCGEKLECVAFYPEPSLKHSARISRIRSRLSGTPLPPLPGWETPDKIAQLEDQDGTDESPRFYCHLDFHECFSPRCKSCKTPIEGEVIVACGAEWHAGHFFCAQCGDPFDSNTPFVEKEGYAWCVGCHTNRYSAKCRGCRKPVVDTVVKALGSEWHKGCFVCVECKGPFDDGRYFLRGESEDPVCVKCEERRLKA